MIHHLLEHRLQEAVRAVLPDAPTENLLVRPCPDPKFGDYQTNALMSVAKQRKMNPRQLATDVLAKLDVSDLCEKVEIAGAGFLNFHVKTSALAQTLQSAARGEHLFFDKTKTPRTVVVDFSSPNVAKPMHVGHIRSTILGDSLARVLRTLGHRVITDNHIGDWGTQFGKLLVGWKNHLNRSALESDPIGEMERLYKLINAACESESNSGTGVSPVRETHGQDARATTVLEAAKEELVKLQSGDEENLRIWREMIALSQHQFDNIYGRLGVKFDHTFGESFYNPWLKETVQELCDKGIARETEGAIGIFSDDSVPKKEDPFLIQRDGEWQSNPCLIQKSDGGFNYATTDLATLKYRLENWNPSEIAYVTDGRQQLHFRQIFAVFARWHPESAAEFHSVESSPSQPANLPSATRQHAIKLAHVWFGSILGDDGKPFKTRSGETVKLAELLDEAEDRAFNVVKNKQVERKEEDRVPENLWPEIARVVGIGSVKYADLQQNRQSDYVFSWDKMLSLHGNTAPYLQYAYTRIKSIFRKIGETSNAEHQTSNIELIAPEEITLAKHLLDFGLALEAVAEDYRPNFLCSYLYELAGHFARFYENCPVLKAEAAERNSRLALCKLTGDVLKQGLELLGIETVEQM